MDLPPKRPSTDRDPGDDGDDVGQSAEFITMLFKRFRLTNVMARMVPLPADDDDPAQVPDDDPTQVPVPDDGDGDLEMLPEAPADEVGFMWHGDEWYWSDELHLFWTWHHHIFGPRMYWSEEDGYRNW